MHILAVEAEAVAAIMHNRHNLAPSEARQMLVCIVSIFDSNLFNSQLHKCARPRIISSVSHRYTLISASLAWSDGLTYLSYESIDRNVPIPTTPCFSGHKHASFSGLSTSQCLQMCRALVSLEKRQRLSFRTGTFSQISLLMIYVTNLQAT